MPDSEPEDVRALRRSLRDLVALTMLPGVWARYEPAQICSDLVDVVARIMDADGVYLRSAVNGCPELLRLRDETDDDLARLLRESADAKSASSAARGTARVLSSPMSFQEDDRFVVAARRPGFPTEAERLILRVALNQAATWLEWKRSEAAAAAESAFRRAIESSVLAGIAVVDAQGIQTYVNRAFAAMVGWDEADLLGKSPPFPYWPPEEMENIEAALREVLAGRANRNGYELRFRRRDETRFDALVLISSFEQASNTRGFLASVYDITERKRNERNAEFLAEAGAMLSRSLDYEETLHSISTLVVPRFADWCFIDLMEGDGSFRRIAIAHPGDSESEALAARLRRSYAPKHAVYGVSETFATGATYTLNDVAPEILDAVARDDAHRDALHAMGIRCFVSVPMTSHGMTFGVITFLGTSRRTHFDDADVALAEELARRAALAVDNARLYRDAQEANRAKDEFLASLSHELRTPMTAILGWAHLLQLGGLEEGQVELGLRTIRQSGDAQARLIDDLLDVSRIVTGKLQLTPSDVDLVAVLENALAAISPASEAKKQRIETAIASGRMMVLGDSSRLQQVFWNLLSNAVKFTPPGGVVRVAMGESGSDVVVTVSDTGEGIPAEFLPLVFERFRQATRSVRSRAGLGLGLAIAKELVELHGGSIVAESAGPGRGSTFRVTLPRHTPAHPRLPRDARRRPAHDALRALRVLLVEDDQATRTLLTTILTNYGAEVSDAACATDAEAVLTRFDPQILITDIEMPGNDGIVLLHTLRSTREGLPAIAVSGHADEVSRARVEAGGFNGFIPKPLDPMALADEIVRVLRG